VPVEDHRRVLRDRMRGQPYLQNQAECVREEEKKRRRRRRRGDSQRQ
jgi:hypothetical protein